MSILNNLKSKIVRNKLNISVIGLGYVGLPVAFFLSKRYKIIGVDNNKNRIASLKKHIDYNKSCSKKDLKNSNITYTSNYKNTNKSDVLIITLPTPINLQKKPNLEFIYQALNSIIKIGIKNKIIVLESTVFPGASENYFIKYLEKKTNLLVNKDFFYGYSPERINPGDRNNNFSNISKIVSGSNKQVCDLLLMMYKKVVKNVYKSSSILCAETSKLIENSQRDLNIAFVNEISIICDKLKIQSTEALNLASTKWNFLDFKPGLVGGHCIGVDPYYLFYTSKKLGYHPKTLLAGRNLNEFFPEFLVKKFLKNFVKSKPNILVMGATYKANCNDLRNSKSFDVSRELLKKNCKVEVYEPNVDIDYFNKLKFVKKPLKNYYDGIIISVDHSIFKKMGYKKILSFGKKDCKILDIKNIFPLNKNIIRL